MQHRDVRSDHDDGLPLRSGHRLETTTLRAAPVYPDVQRRESAAAEPTSATYEIVRMDGRVWLSRNRGRGWRTMIDAETGLATTETCFVEEARFARWLGTRRAVATPVDVETVTAARRWFTAAPPVPAAAGAAGTSLPDRDA